VFHRKTEHGKRVSFIGEDVNDDCCLLVRAYESLAASTSTGRPNLFRSAGVFMNSSFAVITAGEHCVEFNALLVVIAPPYVVGSRFLGSSLFTPSSA
jgi:hypothetical protein